jgi:prepilin-type N-terminal cleavage/methylation domain-containing protein
MTLNKTKTPLDKNVLKSETPAGFVYLKTGSPQIRRGFTLMEIVVSLIILSTVLGGLTATFVGVKRYVARASRRLTAVNLGKQALNALYIQPRADTWNTGVLRAGTYSFAAGGITQVPNSIAIDSFTYGSPTAAVDDAWPDPNSYTVAAVAGREYRQVTVSVWYPTD